MNNIKKILNTNESKQVSQNDEYEEAKVVFNNFITTVIKYSTISHNIDDVLDMIFELRFKEGKTKQIGRFFILFSRGLCLMGKVV